ncbi:MAG: hypothetical protein ACR2OE_17160 [Thermomicrobiales bacterium]
MTESESRKVASPAPALDTLSLMYVSLAFALERHIPGAIDGYMGPEDLRPAANSPIPEPAALLDQAESLLAEIENADLPATRVDYLLAQATGMATMARKMAGEEISYSDEVCAYFDVEPTCTPDAVYDEAIAALNDALPGEGDVSTRMIAYRKGFEVSVDAAREIVPTIIDEVRKRTVAFVPLADGEAVDLSFVEDKPWSGYNWYLGNCRSLIEVNTDLPIKANALLDLMAHEGYSGHHTEHSLKEQRLYHELGYGEHSILLINTPECLISEGIATLAQSVIFAPGEAEEWQAEHVFAPLGITSDPLRDAQVASAQRTLRSVSANAGLLLHQDGASEDEVVAYLMRYGLSTETEARHRFRFVSDPLWGPYVFTYHVGRDLLEAWLERENEPGEQVSASAWWTRRQERFRHLLESQVTPSALASELGDV